MSTEQKPRPQDDILHGLKYIYAENLNGKAVKLVISRVTGGVDFADGRGGKSKGFDIHFQKTDKVLGVCGSTVRRQLAATCGQDTSKWPGKTITLYPVESRKAATGWAIRVKVEEQPRNAPQVEPDAGNDDDLAAEAKRKEAEGVGA